MFYTIDPQHSDIEFKIKHLMISSVKGRFTSFTATMDSEKSDFSDAKIECLIDVGSIDTSITERDHHLRSPDFFDVKRFPKMLFRSQFLERIGENEYNIHGTLTIKDTTKPITLQATYNGSDVDHYGQEKFGFEMQGIIKRQEWDLNFNVAGGRNTLLIGDEVRLNIDIQMMRA
jgi:polyisoprenoid-binding protein YceI